MYDRRSIYALNKKNPDAIVLPDADGNLICLTCADFTDEAEFRRWKRWSDQDFHAEDKNDVEGSDRTTSMDMVPEAALAVPNEEALAAERHVPSSWRIRGFSLKMQRLRYRSHSPRRKN